MPGARHAAFVARRPKRLRIIAIVLGLAALLFVALAAAAGFLDRDPLHIFPASGPRSAVGAVYFSGDMGLHFGMGPPTAAALAQHGIEVVGFSSSTLFATRRDRADIDRIVADAVRQGLARTGARQIVLIGQSFGGDILQTGLAALPADLRARIAAVILVVPSEIIYYRADPSGLAYNGTPDAVALDTARLIDWVPLTCIRGELETDSLCPLLHAPNQHSVAMPGGHFLKRDNVALAAQVLAAIERAVPGATGASHPGRMS